MDGGMSQNTKSGGQTTSAGATRELLGLGVIYHWSSFFTGLFFLFYANQQPYLRNISSFSFADYMN